MKAEFQEVGHCGGQFTVKINTANGKRTYQIGFKISRPVPAGLFSIYALPQGIPVGMIALGVPIGESVNVPPTPDSLQILIASDKQGMFGHQCPKCNGYWRSKNPSTYSPMTCPYCRLRTATHQFLTEGQRKFVQACCELILEAMQSDEDGEHVIDMDQVADAVGGEVEKPQFYYAEESQQNKFECSVCGSFNDILGRYGYCSFCGTHNGLQELTSEIDRIRGKIKSGNEYETCVKDTVAAFDSFARQFSKQFSNLVPMIPARQKEWERRLFHQLKSCAESLQSVFGINLFKGLKQDDVDFAILMFHRRHVYEHNGGEADQKYIDDSGDMTVKPKQVLHETKETAFRILNIILAMAQNFHEAFHLIFTPDEKAIALVSRYKNP